MTSLMLGFERLNRIFNEVATLATNYPPYNVAKIGDNKYLIEMAVAGFGKNDIEVTLEDNRLVITGKSSANNDGMEFLFQGLAKRDFKKQFSVVDTVTVENAELVNGVLKIWLENLIPAPKTKKIEVKTK